MTEGRCWMKNSKIEWTTHTFNPWIGCQEVSPGCGGGEHGAPCYAKTMIDTRYRKVQWGPHGDRLRTSEANWKQPPRWAKAARGSGERPRDFCASLADWLDNKAPGMACRPCGVDRGHTRTGLAASNQAARELYGKRRRPMCGLG